MVYVSVPGFLSSSNQCSIPARKAEVGALGHLITFQAGDLLPASLSGTPSVGFLLLVR